MHKPKTINKITASWEPLGRMPDVSISGIWRMRDMQLQAFSQLQNHRYTILNAPTSSGKTLAICWLGAQELLNNPSLKLIIAVPQTVIGDGFRGFYDLEYKDQDGNLVLDNDVKVGWSPCHYLCSPTPDSNISQIESFLKRNGSNLDINDRILVCSHASFVAAFEKHRDLFINLRLCIDEMHHSKFAEVEDGEYCNQLGKVIAYALRKKECNLKLLLSTATPFRGDRIDVIPQKYMIEFQTFYYPMDEYLKDCKWLKGFSYDFAMYDKSWGKRLTELFKDRVGKTIIYLPSVGSKYYSYGSKQTDVQEIYRAIAGCKKPVVKEQNGLILIQRGSEWVKVVNLVDDGTVREDRKQLIIDAHNHKDNSQIDVIIALNMFREGANWKWADRGIIIGTKGSLTDMIQIIGRFLRDAENKTQVEIVQLLPYSFDQLNKQKFRDNLNEYSKVIFATMLLEDAISPVKIKVPVKKKKGDGIGNFEIEVDYLKRQAKDENHVLKIWKEIRDEAIIVQDNGEVDFKRNSKETREKFESIVSEVLVDNGIKHHHSEIAEYIRKRWIRESLKSLKQIGGMNLEDVDFDTIEINPLQFWLTYSSGMLGLETCRDFRRAIVRNFYLPFEEAREVVRKMGIQTKEEWCQIGSIPIDIPRNPPLVYKNDGWVSWGDWLGTFNVRSADKEFVSYKEAKIYACSSGIKTQAEWVSKAKNGEIPYNIPSWPPHPYKDEWENWGEFLGTGRFRENGWVSYGQCKTYARSLCLKNKDKWFKIKHPNGIPASPRSVYKNEWEGWGQFLGTGNMALSAKDYLSYSDAKAYLLQFKMKNIKDWKQYCKSGKKPKNIPAAPWNTYRNEYKGLADFLGEGVFSKLDALSYDDAKEFVHRLNLKSSSEWIEYCKSGNKPSNIPADPRYFYKEEFEGMGVWLGTGNVHNREKKFVLYSECVAFAASNSLTSKTKWEAMNRNGWRPLDIPSNPQKTYSEASNSWGVFFQEVKKKIASENI